MKADGVQRRPVAMRQHHEHQRLEDFLPQSGGLGQVVGRNHAIREPSSTSARAITPGPRTVMCEPSTVISA